jgi:hypothetical protein
LTPVLPEMAKTRIMPPRSPSWLGFDWSVTAWLAVEDPGAGNAVCLFSFPHSFSIVPHKRPTWKNPWNAKWHSEQEIESVEEGQMTLEQAIEGVLMTTHARKSICLTFGRCIWKAAKHEACAASNNSTKKMEMRRKLPDKVRFTMLKDWMSFEMANAVL